MSNLNLIELAELHNKLDAKFQPHIGQIPIGRAVFYECYKRLFINCGRSFGKSRIAAYIVSRNALEHANSTNYIFLPYLTQAREVYWLPRLLQNIIPEDEIDSINQTEMRITLKNGSFIKLCGADNVESYRGVKCNPNSIVVIEEAKDIKDEFFQAFMPNLSVNDPTLIMIGTPPEFEGPFIKYMNIAKKSDKWFYYHAPSNLNPFVSKQFLDDQKAIAIENDDLESYLREYEAMVIFGGKKTIFPQFLKLEFKPFEPPIDMHKWHLIVSHDPAATSVFGVLFGLFNIYSKKFIIFDEIYESRQEMMTSREIHKAVEEKLKPFKGKVKSISYIYDEAAAYFKSEVHSIDGCDWFLEPTNKASFGIEGYINLLRGCFNRKLITVTDNCIKTKWEFINYVKDDKGRIPKDKDHLVNCLQYLVASTGIRFDLDDEPKIPHKAEQRRGYSMDNELFDNQQGFNEIN